MEYGNDSITTLKGADRVRKRPAVIFGSDGIDGCQHSVFEILSNSIDEAREGYGKKITVTKFSDGSIEVEDHGRGIPVDYNEKEERFNWELVFCEMYAGGKYNNNEGESYEFSLGMNGLGLCSTQYSSEYMDVDIRRDGYRYTLHFEKGENVGGLKKEPYSKKDTGTKITWKPDLEVFTDIAIQPDYFIDIMKRQAIVNAGVEFIFRNQNGRSYDTTSFLYANGVVDHVAEDVLIETVGKDHVAFTFEPIEIVDDFKTRERAAILQRRLIDDDRNARRLDVLHDVLDRGRAEVVAVRLHG